MRKTNILHRMMMLGWGFVALAILSCSKEAVQEGDNLNRKPAEEQMDNPGDTDDTIPEEPDDECGYQEEGDPFGGNLVEVNITAEAAEVSKTTLGSGNVVNWVAGDAVRCRGHYVDGSTKKIVYYDATAKTTGHTTAFTPVTVREDLQPYLYITYPASASTYLSANVDGTPRVRIKFPKAPTSSDFGAANIVMAKTRRNNSGVWGTSPVFKNVSAIFKINITDADIDRIVISSEGGEYIACEHEYGITDAGTLFANGSIQDNDNKSTTITLDIDGTGVHYIAAHPCTLSTGFRVTPYKGEEAQTPFCYLSEYVLERGKIVNLGTLDSHAGQFYVTPDGAGNNSGVSWTHAMSQSQFKALVAEKATNGEAATQAERLNGATFHFAAGTYDLEEMLELGFPGQTSSVPALTFVGTATAGGDTTVFTGNDTHRIFNIESPINLSVSNIKFVHSYGEEGGGAGVRLQQSNSTLSLTNCQFRYNVNSGYDGGALMLGNGTSSVSGCSFSNNSADNHGSGISINGAGNITLTGCEFKVNTGASLRFNNVSSFGASGCEFKKNNACCIRVMENNTMDLTFTSCTFEDNADGGGAVLYNRGASSVTFDGTTSIKNCYSTACGGAIVMRMVSSGESATAGDLTIKGTCTIDGCYSEADPNEPTHNGSGPALYLNTTGTVSVTGATIKNCYTADFNGGAVAIFGGGTFTFTNTTFKANHTNQGGGAIYAKNGSATYNFRGCTFDGNYATGLGTGTGDNSGASTDQNTGAVVYATNGGTVLNFTNTTMKNNYNIVGAAAIYGGIIRLGASAAKACFNGCVFDGNYTNRTNQRNEPCAAIINNRLGSSFYFNACEFKENTSGTNNNVPNEYGGLRGTVIACLGAGTIAMNNCSMHDNYGGRANDDISWIGMDNTSSTLILANTTIVGDNVRAPKTGGAVRNNWGVIKLHNLGNYYFINSILCSNDADADPGNCFWVNGDIIVSGSTKIKDGGTKLPVTSYYCKTSKEGDNWTNWGSDTGSGHNYYASASSFSGYEAPAGTHDYQYMYWNGTMTGTNSGSFAATANVNIQINSADSDFYDWLDEIGALGKDFDGRNRGTYSWPGCYQGSPKNSL